MKTWLPLQANDVACVIAPSYSSVVSHHDVEDVIKQNSLTLYIYPNINAPGNHSVYDKSSLRLANSDERRAEDFLDAMNNSSCKLVWAITGGYGTIKLIKHIKNAPEPQEVKLLMGFSDITLLHLFIQKKWGWPSMHCGMPGALGLNQTLLSPEAQQDIGDILFGSVATVSFSLHQLSKPKNSDISGVTTGGNILTFSRSFGTEIRPDLVGKILVFEEVGENKRKIDGMLEQLQLLSDFDKVSAVVFGDLTGAEDEKDEGEEPFAKISNDFALNGCVPVFRLDAKDTIGHGKEINRALPMGTKAMISCEPDCQIVVETGISSSHNEDL